MNVAQPPESVPTALQRLDEDLTRAVVLPPVDTVIRQADAANRSTTAATVAVVTVGALRAMTLVAQSVASGAVPLPIPVALAPATTPTQTEPKSATPAVADVLGPGEQLVRLKPGIVAPAGSRTAADGAVVLAAASPARTTRTSPPAARPAPPAVTTATARQAGNTPPPSSTRLAGTRRATRAATPLVGIPAREADRAATTGTPGADELVARQPKALPMKAASIDCSSRSTPVVSSRRLTVM
jgi:hypothetical protein